MRMNYDTLADLAQDPNTHLDTLLSIAEHPNSEIRSALAHNPNLPSEVLVKMFSHNDEFNSVRMHILKHPNFPPDQLAHIGTYHQAHHDLLAVASNPSTPPDVIFLLTRAEHPYVKEAALNNPSLPDHVRAMMALGE
jgi:hypothetical protein